MWCGEVWCGVVGCGCVKKKIWMSGRIKSAWWVEKVYGGWEKNLSERGLYREGVV